MSVEENKALVLRLGVEFLNGRNLDVVDEIFAEDFVDHQGVARTSAGVQFEDRGEHELKGIEEPQRLFAVRESAGGG